jgi:hypothetical protein
MRTIPVQIESILTKQQLEQDYLELKSITKIAQKYAVSNVAIKSRLVKYGISFISKNQHNECNHNIFSEDSELSFYLAGFLAADGCIRISKTNSKNSYVNHRVVIGLSIKDESYLKKIQKLLGSNHKLNHYVHKLSKYNDKWEDSESVKLSITSKQMVNDLQRFNIGPRKSLTYKFPEWIINHPLVHHFMRGYFDGDGSFYLNSDLSYDRLCCSIRGTPDFLKVFRSVLETQDINGGSLRKNEKVPQLSYKGKLAVWVRDFLYEEATIYMDRKWKMSHNENIKESFKKWSIKELEDEFKFLDPEFRKQQVSNYLSADKIEQQIISNSRQMIWHKLQDKEYFEKELNTIKRCQNQILWIENNMNGFTICTIELKCSREKFLKLIKKCGILVE